MNRIYARKRLEMTAESVERLVFLTIHFAIHLVDEPSEPLLS